MKKRFPFDDASDTACFTCCHILDEHKPILYVSHDEDGYWQFLCGENHTVEDARIISLSKILEIDGSMSSLAKLDYGQYAEAENEESDWVVGYKNK